MYYNIIKLRDKEIKNMRITVNNTTMTREKAIMNAKQINEQTGLSVEVCDMLGDTILYITKSGRIIEY